GRQLPQLAGDVVGHAGVEQREGAVGHERRPAPRLVLVRRHRPAPASARGIVDPWSSPARRSVLSTSSSPPAATTTTETLSFAPPPWTARSRRVAAASCGWAAEETISAISPSSSSPKRPSLHRTSRSG